MRGSNTIEFGGLCFVSKCFSLPQCLASAKMDAHGRFAVSYRRRQTHTHALFRVSGDSIEPFYQRHRVCAALQQCDIVVASKCVNIMVISQF